MAQIDTIYNQTKAKAIATERIADTPANVLRLFVGILSAIVADIGDRPKQAARGLHEYVGDILDSLLDLTQTDAKTKQAVRNLGVAISAPLLRNLEQKRPSAEAATIDERTKQAARELSLSEEDINALFVLLRNLSSLLRKQRITNAGRIQSRDEGMETRVVDVSDVAALKEIVTAVKEAVESKCQKLEGKVAAPLNVADLKQEIMAALHSCQCHRIRQTDVTALKEAIMAALHSCQCHQIRQADVTALKEEIITVLRQEIITGV